MNQTEATARARTFVLETTGIDVDPDWIRLEPDNATWTALYGAEHFFPDHLAATVEDAYIVRIDDQTGETSLRQ